jgi:hypothetical protein
MTGLTGRTPIGMAVIFSYDKRFGRYVYLLGYYRRFFTLAQRPSAYRACIQGYFNCCVNLFAGKGDAFMFFMALLSADFSFFAA